MGTEISRSHKGFSESPVATISIIPQAVNYEEGSCIKGIVELTIQHSISIPRIFLKITGKEKLIVFQSKRSIIRHNRFLNNQISICEFPGSIISQGHYELPFSLQLPSILPGSFFFRDARISYKLQAILPLDNSHSIKSVQPILIVQKDRSLPSVLLPGMELSFQNYKTDDQYIRSRIILNKSAFLIHESIHFALEVKNERKKRIRKIEIRVYRYFTFKAKNRATTLPLLLTTVERSTDISAKTDYIREKALNFSVPVSTKDGQNLPTTEGSFMSCYYKLVVLKAGSWRKAPRTLAEIPIRVLPDLMKYPAPRKLSYISNHIQSAPFEYVDS
jgi:hypothetical protein